MQYFLLSARSQFYKYYYAYLVQHADKYVSFQTKFNWIYKNKVSSYLYTNNIFSQNMQGFPFMQHVASLHAVDF